MLPCILPLQIHTGLWKGLTDYLEPMPAPALLHFSSPVFTHFTNIRRPCPPKISPAKSQSVCSLSHSIPLYLLNLPANQKETNQGNSNGCKPRHRRRHRPKTKSAGRAHRHKLRLRRLRLLCGARRRAGALRRRAGPRHPGECLRRDRRARHV